MKINIETIPHSQHRYPTCGDWWVGSDMTVEIRVSDNLPNESKGAVIIHELVEFFLCTRGFNLNPPALDDLVRKVDEFDKNFKGEGEPGDDSEAPYNTEHSIATAVERIVLAFLGFTWAEHDRAVERLFE